MSHRQITLGCSGEQMHPLKCTNRAAAGALTPAAASPICMEQTDMDEITPGLCQCGCGQRTGIAKQANRKYGWVKGQPVRFVPGHQMGRIPRGERHPDWKGDAASYGVLHRWLRRNCPKSGICDQCGRSGRTHYALIHGREYSRNREDYRELCPRCHGRYDQTGAKHAPGVDAKKLTEDIVREIRQQRALGATYESLAMAYSLSSATIWNVVNRKTWAHVLDTA